MHVQAAPRLRAHATVPTTAKHSAAALPSARALAAAKAPLSVSSPLQAACSLCPRPCDTGRRPGHRTAPLRG